MASAVVAPCPGQACDEYCCCIFARIWHVFSREAWGEKTTKSHIVAAPQRPHAPTGQLRMDNKIVDALLASGSRMDQKDTAAVAKWTKRTLLPLPKACTANPPSCTLPVTAAVSLSSIWLLLSRTASTILLPVRSWPKGACGPENVGLLAIAERLADLGHGVAAYGCHMLSRAGIGVGAGFSQAFRRLCTARI